MILSLAIDDDKENKSHSQKRQGHGKKVLVIAGGGFRGAYALGVMKALEKCHIKDKIDAIYGVSIGAIIGSLWANGMKAEKIFELLTNISVKDFYGNDIFRKSGGLVSNQKIAGLFNKYLPEDFESLKIPFYAGATDTNTANFILFTHGNLRKIILGSMSIPGFFPPVKYDKFSLIDGFVLNNFPVDLAKKTYPNHEIIGIELNTFIPNQKIETTIDSLTITFDVLMHHNLKKKKKRIDYPFYGDPSMGILSLNNTNMHKSFDLGYKDGIKTFKKNNLKCKHQCTLERINKKI